MTYIQLINAVLTRLREDTINVSQVDSDPYFRSIGAHVNDAKVRVEDAWQWSALRGSDVVRMDNPSVEAVIGSAFALPDSADNHYIIKGFYGSNDSNPSQYHNVRQISRDLMVQRYASGTNTPSGRPTEVAINKREVVSGNIQIIVYPVQELTSTDTLIVDRVSHQQTLVSSEDRLLVPSLPVYTLATALASRERGEVGGTPTSELFAIADRHLSDAIAQDSSLYPDELDWYSAGGDWVNTNVKNA